MKSAAVPVATAQSYKTRKGGTFDRAQKPARMPELEKEIAKRKAEIMSGERFPTWESRDCDEFDARRYLG